MTALDHASCWQSHLHNVHCIVHCVSLDSFQQDLHNILAPVVVVIVEHDLVDWGLLLAAFGTADQ